MKKKAKKAGKDKKKLSKKIVNRKKNKKLFIFSKSIFKFVFLLVLIILLCLSFYLFIASGIIDNPFKNMFTEVSSFRITDDCSMIAGQLIHTIPDEDACKSRCRNFCEVMDKKFVDSLFSKVGFDCNSCECYCR